MGAPVFRMDGFAELVAAQEQSSPSIAPDDSSESAWVLAKWLEVPMPRPSTREALAGRAGWLSMTRVVEAGSARGSVIGEGVEDVF